jgi:Mg2+ and Co2+ transporter CorA
VFGASDGEREVELGVEQASSIDPETELVWLIVTVDPDDVASAAATVGEAPRQLERLLRLSDRPAFRDDGRLSALHVHIPSLEPGVRAASITCIIAPGWVITAQRGESDALDRFGQHVADLNWLGALDSASFAALLLDWLFTQYILTFEDLENRVDSFDAAVLRGDLSDAEGSVAVLVGLRRQVSTLRRLLAPHRDLVVWISHAREHHLVTEQAMQHLEQIGPRIEQALQAADTSRDSINGSFALLMSTTAQRTNDVMRVLTVVSVTLLPATLIASVMGMNFHPGFFDDATLFWVVVLLMSALITTALLGARTRRWL